jgi:putative ABC transport system permease protein
LDNGIYGKSFYDIEERLNSGSSPAIVEALAMQSDLFESGGMNSTQGKQLGIEEPYGDNRVRTLTLPYRTKDFFQLKIVEGEWFKQPVDVINEQPVLLNPEAIEVFQLQDYATRNQLVGYSNNEWSEKVVPLRFCGVVSFRTRNLHRQQEPLFIYCSPDGRTNHGGQWGHNVIYVKHQPGKEAEARQEIVKVLKEFDVPEEGIDVTRLGNRVLEFYKEEQNYLNVFTVIVAGSVLITLFGVLSMILYVLRLQRRSIAIRRVFGATFGDICRKYLRGYVTYTVLGAILAYPVGVMVMNWWLEGYDVRISVGWLQGLVTLALMLLLVVSVVIVQIYRVTRENPASVVKSE